MKNIYKILTGVILMISAGLSAGNKNVIMVPVAEEKSWQDLAFLAAIPAGMKINDGIPVVLALEPNEPLRPELQDFFVRYKPDKIYMITAPSLKKENSFTSMIKEVHEIPVNSAANFASTIAKTFWENSQQVVLCNSDDYGNCLAASALAGRLKVPLLFYSGKGMGNETREIIKELSVTEALVVGPEAPKISNVSVTLLKDPHKIIKWMVDNNFPVDYLVVTNPRDRSKGMVKKISLSAPMLAAGRNGAVALLDFDTQWKVSFRGGKPLKEKPEGAPDSKCGWKTGKFKINGKEFSFILTGIRKDKFNRVSIAPVNSKKYEGPFLTGDRTKLGDRFYTVNIGPKDGIGNFDLRLTWPGIPEIKERLNSYYKTLGKHPEYLCIMGWPDTIPLAIIRKNKNDTLDVSTDVPFANVDKDPFLEIAIGRFVTEDLYTATLLASRTLSYEQLFDPSWTGKCGTACWESLMDQSFQNMGYGPTIHHDGKTKMKKTSPLRNVAAIAHMEHSGWKGLGKFYNWNQEVLLAPMVIETGGCSTMSLDREKLPISAPARLLRNGAVCVAGNVRLGIGQQEHYQTEWWNAVGMGKSVGQAHRYALNRTKLSVLEKKQVYGGGDRYQFYNRSLFGDPALVMHMPSKPQSLPARTTREGDIVTVHTPEKWWKYKEHMVSDWKYDASPQLYSFRGFGVGEESFWYNPDRYDKHVYIYVAEIRTKEKIKGIEQITEAAKPLGYTGNFWVNKHQDGTNSVYWRVRMIDVDKPTGKILKQVDQVKFKLKK